MKVQTVKLQNMVTKAIKGVGANKLISITSKIGIKLSNSKFTLMTTDATSYLSVSDDVTIDSEDFNCTVDADMFAKLISKLTNDTTELEVVDNTLVITSNGKYKIAIESDDNGDMLIFPEPEAKEELTEMGELTVQDIAVMNDVLKSSLSANVGSCYANYIIGQFAVSTDRAMLSAYDKTFFEKNYLFTREFAELLGLSDKNWKISEAEENVIIADNENGMRIYTRLTANKDISEYSIDGVNRMLGLEYSSYCKVKKSELLSTLERIAIFVSAYDESAVNIHFTQDGIEVFSMQDRGAELVEYMEQKDFKDCKIKIDINRLITQLKAYKSDSVDLHFGNPMCIKLIDGDIAQIIALMA